MDFRSRIKEQRESATNILICVNYSVRLEEEGLQVMFGLSQHHEESWEWLSYEHETVGGI